MANRILSKYDYDIVFGNIVAYLGFPAILGGSAYGAHIAVRDGGPNLRSAVMGSIIGSVCGFGLVGLTAAFHPLVPFVGASVPVYAYHKYFKNEKQLK